MPPKTTQTEAPATRSTPVASPEFAAARIIRDLRLNAERTANLTETYREKLAKLEKQKEALDADIEKLRKTYEQFPKGAT